MFSCHLSSCGNAEALRVMACFPTSQAIVVGGGLGGRFLQPVKIAEGSKGLQPTNLVNLKVRPSKKN